MKTEGFTDNLGAALRLGAAFRAALFWTALGSGSALAGGVVTNCAEADVRAAMEGGGLVTLACDGTITLSNTLRFTANTILDARGHSVVLSGGNAVRVLEAGPGAQVALFNLTITQGRSTNGGGIYNEGALALSQCNVLSNWAVGLPGAAGATGIPDGGIGSYSGGAGGAGGTGMDTWGGGVFNTGVLRASNCVFAGNQALAGNGGTGGRGGGGALTRNGYSAGPGGAGGNGGAGGRASGGALCNLGDALCVQASFLGNGAQGGLGGADGPAGGGMSYGTAGVGGPGGSGKGGACYNAGSLALVQTTAAANEAAGGRGGQSPESEWHLIPSVAKGGSGAPGAGGGLFNVESAWLLNVTLCGNRAAGGAGGWGGYYTSPGYHTAQAGNGADGTGGALLNLGSLSATNCTLWNNQAIGGEASNRPGAGGTPTPPYLLGTPGQSRGATLCASNPVAVLNTILGGAGSTSNCAGALTDLGHNLCSDASAAFTRTGSLNSTDPLLAGLGDNGGPTRTLALRAGSPAINAGDPSVYPAVDQRGVARPAGPASDIGAFEGNGLLLPVLTMTLSPGSIIAGATATLQLTVANPNSYPLHGLACSDTLPPGLFVAAGPQVVSSCGGDSWTAAPASGLVLWSIPQLGAGQSCTLQAGISSGVPGLWTNRALEFAAAETGPLAVELSAVLAVTGPNAITAAASSVTSDSALLNGSANPNGAAASAFFQYGPTTNYGQATPAQSLGSGTANVAVTASLSGLPNTTPFHFRLVAQNANGAVYGTDQCFTTLSGIAATTGAAGSIARDAALLNGTVNPAGLQTTVFFQYGTTTDYGHETPGQSAGAGASDVPVSASLSGLAYHTTYHYRVAARNTNGNSGYGADQTFTTLPELAAAATGSVTALTTNSATLTGSVTPNGLPTLGWFEYGLTASYGSQTPAQDAGGGVAPASLSAALDGLVSGLTYHYRMVATNLGGRVCGPDQTFMTISPAGMALVFSAASQLWLASALPMADMPPWTAELWFRSASGAGGGLVGGGASGMFPDQNFQVYLTPNGQVHFGVSGTNSTQVIHTTNSYTDGQWHHVAASVSAQGARLFLDGRLAAQETAFTNFRGYGGCWIVGYGNLEWPGLLQPHVNAEIDEVRVWTRARSAEEIRADMYRILSGPEPGLAMRWRFDEAGSASVTDSSGQGNAALVYTMIYYHGTPIYTLSRTPSGFLGSTLSQRADGAKFVRFQVSPAAISVLQASTDLVHWTNVATNSTPGVQAMDYEDCEARPHRFYRLVSPE